MKPLQLIIDMVMFSSAQYVISCPTPSRYSCRATLPQSCITEPRRTPSKTKHWTPDLTALPPLRCHCSLTPPLRVNGFYHLIYSTRVLLANDVCCPNQWAEPGELHPSTRLWRRLFGGGRGRPSTQPVCVGWDASPHSWIGEPTHSTR